MEEIKNKLNQKIQVLKLLNTVTRLRIILVLMVYGKQSLAQLRDKTGKTKATITNHIKKFENLGIINTSRKDAKGSIDAKVYELIPGFIDLIKLNPEDINLLSEEEQKIVLKFFILRDKWMFEMMRNIFQLLTLYYSELKNQDIDFESKETVESDFEKKEESDSKKDDLFDFKNLEEFKNHYFESIAKYQILFLNEGAKRYYDALLMESKTKLHEKIKKDDDLINDYKRPYLVFDTMIPLENILRFDPETRQFIRFFKVFDK
ncbi:MAG: hypothetical protein BAJALOKI1v1_90034 [Promethearchaeota archaeon]|nr:MAG: hypothetical protein BAJALOKI1v1_90034 [Candidatus Lokiarchaeota archaeon]